MNTPSINRRRWLQSAAAGISSSLLARHAPAAPEAASAPVQVITRGPKHHWFGYYDKLQFDPTMRYVLGMQVDFEHRSPRPDDVIRIGMVDRHDDNRWIELGTSTAWCWQQGCMLQWIPGSKSQVLWNDRDSQRYVCRIVDVQSRQMRTVDTPIYTLSPDGRSAVAADFRRINDMRPGYGYTGIADPHADELAPEQSGIRHVDLRTGQSKLIVPIADVARLGQLPGGAEPNAKHYFNHLLFNTDGTRLIFLHRWRAGKSWKTRMLTAAPDGSDVRVIDDNGLTSHFNWRDPQHILAYSRQPSHGARFYLFRDAPTPHVEPVGAEAMKRDGHCSYLPGGEWIVNDTYPDRERMQTVYLYHLATGRTATLGRFHLPTVYAGEWRCDTHPRISPDGRMITIDAPHADQGRQLHLIDISQIVG